MKNVETTFQYWVEFKLPSGWRKESMVFTTVEEAQKYRAKKEKSCGLEGRIIKTTKSVTTETIIGIKTVQSTSTLTVVLREPTPRLEGK